MHTRAARRHLFACSIAVIASAALPAGSGGSAVPAHPDDRTIVHVLNRLGFGPAPGDIERIRRIGLARYIDQQLEPGTLEDAGIAVRLARFETLQKSASELAQDYFVPAMMERRRAIRAQMDPAAPSGATESVRDARTPGERAALRHERDVLLELSQQKLLRAAYSRRQLEEQMVDFWFNHFNVFAGKGATRVYLTAYERDTIRPHALGKFRDLLGATAQSPAMLF
jgi:uncharacterized protein (DUF1800 family)